MKEEDRPRFILVSDFQTFELRDLEEQRRVPFRLQELPEHVEEFEFILEAAHGKETWKAPEFVLPRQWEERYPTNLGSVDAVRPQLEAASEIVLKWPKSLPDGEEIRQTRAGRAGIAHRGVHGVDDRCTRQARVREIGAGGRSSKSSLVGARS